MSDKTSKLIQWFLYILLALSAVFGLLFYTNTARYTDLLLYWGYALIIFVVVATLLATLFIILRNPKASVKLLIAIALVVVIAIVAYAVSGNEFSTAQLEKLKISESTSRMVGAGLVITYLLGIVAILSIAYTAVSRLFK